MVILITRCGFLQKLVPSYHTKMCEFFVFEKRTFLKRAFAFHYKHAFWIFSLKTRILALESGTKCTLRSYLVYQLKHMFLVFKQHYMYFHTLFYPYVFIKKIENCCLNKHTKLPQFAHQFEGDMKMTCQVPHIAASSVLPRRLQ